MKIEYLRLEKGAANRVLQPAPRPSQSKAPITDSQPADARTRAAVAAYLRAVDGPKVAAVDAKLQAELQQAKTVQVALGQLDNFAAPLASRAATFAYARRSQQGGSSSTGFFARMTQMALDSLQQPRHAPALRRQTAQAQALSQLASCMPQLRRLVLSDWPAFCWVPLKSLFLPMTQRGLVLPELHFEGGVLTQAPPGGMAGLAALQVESLTLAKVQVGPSFFADLLNAVNPHLVALTVDAPQELHLGATDGDDDDDNLLADNLLDLAFYLGHADAEPLAADGQEKAASAGRELAWPVCLLQLPLVLLPQLTLLQLHGCDLDVALLGSRQLPQLKELELHDGWFGDRPLEVLAAGAWIQLRTLSCFRMRLPEAAQAPSQSLCLLAPHHFPALENMTFGHNRRGRRLVAASAAALMEGELAKLHVLDLRGTPLRHLPLGVLGIPYRQLPATLVVDQYTLTKSQRRDFRQCVPPALSRVMHGLARDETRRNNKPEPAVRLPAGPSPLCA